MNNQHLKTLDIEPVKPLEETKQQLARNHLTDFFIVCGYCVAVCGY